MRFLEPLAPELLRRTCVPDELPFETTDELPELDAVLGQDRGMRAIEFGLRMTADGYNVFVIGPTGMFRHGAVCRFLSRLAAGRPTPSDLAYVHNFDEPHRPLALELPAGRGRALVAAMDELIETLGEALPAALECDGCRAGAKEITARFKARQELALEKFKRRALERDVGLVRAQAGLALTPLKDGEPIDQDAFLRLHPSEQDRIHATMKAMSDDLKDTLRLVPRWEREEKRALAALHTEFFSRAVNGAILDVKGRFADLPRVLAWLDDVAVDVVENAVLFAPELADDATRALLAQVDDAFARYRVNLAVDHAGTRGAPVVVEDNPTFRTLVGAIDHEPRNGGFVTSFEHVRPGALHRANGGVLVLDARKLLTQPLAWEQLKRALNAREARIEAPARALELMPTATLDPKPVPLRLKVVLVGSRALYHALYEADPEFAELFKVVADFDDRLDRDGPGIEQYARLAATLCREQGLRPFDRGAIARIVDRASRLAGDGERLSTELHALCDTLREADFWAGEAGGDVVTADDVRRALDEQEARHGRMRERIHEEIRRGTILIDTTGRRVGQVNGLSVTQMGRVRFGRPHRITARIRLGRGDVIDIEREVRLGGPLHSKGILILTGFLGQRFAIDRPLSLSASLVFEQSYNGVDGDSASLAELCALLSALSGVPIRQDLAITGSLNQHGEAQPIGGVNDKIEGFFDVCAARGLTGTQGVVIPDANTRHLMLREDVVEACRAGRFHVFAVRTADEAMELLTGVTAGRRDPRGMYPAGTLYRLVEARLVQLADRATGYRRAIAANEGF